jgi:hypothetical protein
VSALPPIDQASLPADVRAGSANDRARYQAALGFERQLALQLTQQLTRTAGDALGSGPYAQLLPDAMADSIVAAGGLGLARQLAEAQEPSA